MTSQKNISAVILTKNESSTIAHCLKNLQFCTEIIVIDDYSTDNTIILAKKMGARVYKRHLHNNFAAQRNYALSKVSNEWVLFIDADEKVSPLLKKEIQSAVTNTSVNGFYIERKDVFLGKQLNYGEFGKMRLLRLGRKGIGKWVRPVHETWNITEETAVLKEPLLHNSHNSLSQFITQVAFHATLHAKQKSRELGKVSLVRVFLYPFGKFLYNFIIRQGFRDGSRGFVAAVLMSFHSFLAWSSTILEYDKKH